MKPTSDPNGEAASANITKRIQELADWRGETLAHVRQLIHDADPDIQEEWKWENTRRAIDFREGEKIDEAAFKQLIRAAVEANSAVRAQQATKKK